MLYYAMVVVVEAPDGDEAHKDAAEMMDGSGHTRFVGDPWPVTPLDNSDRDQGPWKSFDTVSAINQLPQEVK